MKRIEIKEEFVKITGSIYGAIIFDYLVEKHQEKCFSINLESVVEDNMLDISRSTIRREIKKLVEKGLLIEYRNEKTYQYQIDKSRLKSQLKSLGIFDKIKDYTEELEFVDEIGQIYTQTEMSKDFNEIQNQNCIILHNNDTILQGKGQDKILENLEDFLKNNIEYEILVSGNRDESERSIFESMYLIMLETLTSKEKYIRINSKEVHIAVVKSVFKKVKATILQDVAFKLKKIDNKIRNFKNYVTTAIYNTYLENEFQTKNSLYCDLGIC